MSSFRRDFRKSAEYFVGVNAGTSVNDYSDRVQRAIDECVGKMGERIANVKNMGFAKGFLAEEWHAGTYNVDVARQDLHPSPSATPLRSPDPRIDIEIERPGFQKIEVQVKNYTDPNDSRDVINQRKYDGIDEKVVPKGHVIDPQHTDRIRAHGAESRPLEEPASREMVDQLRQEGDVDRERYDLTVPDTVGWEDILREATTAGGRAAILSAVLQTCPYLLAIAKRTWETGELSAKDFAPLARALPKTLIRSGMAGGLSAAVIGAVRKGVLGSTRQVSPTVVAAAVVLAMGAFKTSVKAARGEINWPLAAKCISEDAIVLAAAMGSAAVGQVLIPILGLGALVGNIVGAALARLAMDKVNGVVLGIAAETGWTVFGLVDQDYTVPGELLKASGWNVLDISRFTPRRLDVLRFRPLTIKLNKIDMTVLRRGVISFGRVAYLP